MLYYEVAVLGAGLKPLTYSSNFKIPSYYQIVSVPVKSSVKSAVLLREVVKPTFKTKEILEISQLKFTQFQSTLANFIANYYVCEKGVAFGIFEPAGKTERDYANPATKQNCISEQTPAGEQNFALGGNCGIAQNSDAAVQNHVSPLSPLQIGKIPNLTPAQEQARKFAEANETSLIFGDTGSGKSEIYIALIAQALAAGKQALFLMPEISLTPQMTKRLQSYFGERLGVWHSKISPKKKREILAKFNAGEIRLIAGARSALFLPFSDLGLIVVDEEHDDSYKSAAAPRLNARDAAIFVGKKLGIRVVLGSATPALSTYAKQPHFRLRGTYFGSAKRFIFDESETGLSPKILTEIGRSLEAGKQAVVFLPTRANYKYMVCENCGQIVRCPFCAVGMSYHADAAALKCHYCGFSTFYRASCENCGGEVMQARKIGTGELAAQLAARFPSARIAKFDRDEITTQRKLEALLNNFKAHKIDILVGTQMLSKGHDYHGVDLAVIMGIDEHLSYPDFRAREKTLALAMQVAGRAGRSGQGRVVIQTRQSGFFRDYIENYDDFLRDEEEFREGLYPPYMRLLRVLISHKNEKAAGEIMNVALELLRRKQAGSSAFVLHDGLDARRANLSALNLENSAQQGGKQISNFKFQSPDLRGNNANSNRHNASNLKNTAQISACDGDTDSVNLKPERNGAAQNFINLETENPAENSAQYLKEKASESFEIIGYGKAGIAYIASKFRFEILLRASSHVPLINAARALEHLPVEIDMDPVNFG